MLNTKKDVMFGLIDKISRFWSKHGFSALIIATIVIILGIALYTRFKGGSGSYSKNLGENFKSMFFDNSLPSDYRTRSSYQHPPPSSPSGRRYSKGETECRRVLEVYFKRPFPSVRPDFLRNPVTGGKHNLEIDCYNKDLKLGVEYNGVQHYKYSKHFHRSQEAFQNQQYRDLMKQSMCKKNGITLIEVPYTVKHADIENYLIHKLKQHGY